MDEKKLTDEETVKAAQCCLLDVHCKKCPLFLETSCLRKLKEATLDLIQRSQAEIERLTEENGRLEGYNSGLKYENAELQKQVDKLLK